MNIFIICGGVTGLLRPCCMMGQALSNSVQGKFLAKQLTERVRLLRDNPHRCEPLIFNSSFALQLIREAVKDLAKKDEVIAEKDEVIAEKDGVIAKKDEALQKAIDVLVEKTGISREEAEKLVRGK